MNDALSTSLVLLMGLGLTIAGIASLSFRKHQRSRLRRMPRTLAGEARAGSTVKLMGWLVAREPVHAPLADKDCAYFQMTVKESRDAFEDSERSWETLFTEREFAEGWELEDESGLIEVRPEGAQLQFLRRRTFTPGGVIRDPSLRYELLGRYFDNQNTNERMLQEERLELRTPVVLVGRVEEGPEGRVLTGGSELHIYGELEEEVSAFSGTDLLSWAMLLAGLLLCAAWASQLLVEPGPLPNLGPVPIGPRGR